MEPISKPEIEVQQVANPKSFLVMEDKCLYVIRTNLEKVKNSAHWSTPFAIFLSVLLTLATTTFKTQFLWWDAATWRALFILVGIFSFGWLVYTIKKSIDSRGIDEYSITEELKNELPKRDK